jgi:hypothetical protein
MVQGTKSYLRCRPIDSDHGDVMAGTPASRQGVCHFFFYCNSFKFALYNLIMHHSTLFNHWSFFPLFISFHFPFFTFSFYSSFHIKKTEIFYPESLFSVIGKHRMKFRPGDRF